MRDGSRRALVATLIAALGTLVLATACRDRGRREPGSPAAPETGAGPGESPPLAFPAIADHTFGTPVRLTLTPNEDLLVTDYRRRAVFRVDPATLLPTSGFPVDGRPLGIAYRGGRVFVGNATRGTVDVFGRNGRWRSSFGRGLLSDPKDLAVDGKRGLLFVVDGRTRRVTVFDLKGRFLYAFGGWGFGPGDLQNPTAIALDPGREEVLVSDYGDLSGAGPGPAVKIFTYAGTFLDEISGSGGGGGMLGGWFGGGEGFSRPQGLAVDGKGRVFLADALLGQILIYDRSTGERLGTLGEYGTGPGRLLLPLDVAIGRKGDVFATSSQDGRVELFRKGATRP